MLSSIYRDSYVFEFFTFFYIEQSPIIHQRLPTSPFIHITLNFVSLMAFKLYSARIQEDGRRQWRNGFGINEREQQYVYMKSQPKNEKYANGSVGARVRLMVRGGCLPVRGSKGMDWKYDDDLCVCGTKETEIHVLFECKCYDMVRRRWLRTWDVLEEKERTMGVIKGYVEVNDDVENETMKYLGEVWTERQRNERNRVNVIL